MRDDIERVEEGGFGLVEFTFAGGLFVTGVLALLSTLLSSMVLARDTKETNLAHDEVMSVIENVKDAARSNFTGALTTLVNQPSQTVALKGLGSNAMVSSRLILDETQISPPMDLNGDGDFDDRYLYPNEVNAAYIKTTVSWQGSKGNRQMTFVNIVSRRSIASSGGQTQTEGTPKGGGTTGGNTQGGNGGTAQVTSSVVSFPAIDKLEVELVMSGVDPNLPLTGVTVESSIPGYVKEVHINGDKLFAQKNSLPATGTEVPVAPTFLQEGPNTIDTIKFTETSSGGGLNVTQGSFTITLHFEDGSSSSFVAGS